MGNKKKNIARSFKLLWATFSKIMGNEFYAYGQRYSTTSPNSIAEEALVIFTIAVNTGPLPDQVLVDRGANLLFPDMATLATFIARSL